MSTKRNFAGNNLKIAVIGDEDTVAGFILAGIGYRDRRGSPNYLVVSNRTATAAIEDAFKDFSTRTEVGIILINQPVADKIRHLLDTYHSTIPTVLEIPSKDAPYDASKDSVMQRVKMFFGGSLPTF